MKFTNVKQLIIKFMGGGLINFPTRFLRWVKINGDSDGSDDGGDGGSIEIDYEAIYQFYKSLIIASVPPQALETFILPNTLNDIIEQENDIYPENTFGFWIVYPTDFSTIDSNSYIAFCKWIDGSPNPEYFVIFGKSKQTLLG